MKTTLFYKYSFLLLLLFYNSFSLSAQQSFFYTLTAKTVGDVKISKLYVAYEMAGIKYQDSFDIKNASIKAKKILAQPVAATIFTDNKYIEPVPVVLANNNLAIVINKHSISINKSKLQADFQYLTANDRIRPGYFPLYGELTAKNDIAGLRQLSKVFDSLKVDDISKSLSYFKANKTSLLSLFAFSRYTAFFADYSKVESDFSLLPLWAVNSPDGKGIAAKIEGAKAVQVNTKARKFEQKSSDNKIISLDSYQGKYVFLDFWASWCAPCRKEHPNLIKTYEAFKSSNFEIIGVSLDSDRVDWLNAISKDMISWVQISDLKGQLNDIAVLYGIQSIPANFLIDPTGMIIAKNLSSEELHKKLVSLLGK